jgi:hypothetical protein
MSRRKYRKPIADGDPIVEGRASLRIDRPVVVYYRQSDRSQVGNVSTAMQVEDLPGYLQRLGWASENIILIDDDMGVSGAMTINQRTGMLRLISLIIHGSISAVACQDEDRLFRDATQIQVNLFVQACLEAGVVVITPQMIYDFAGPNGFIHARQFRYKSELAADFLDSHVRGRLVAAKQRLLAQGIWVGGNIPVGFILDGRRTLSDGSPNPQWHKYAPFTPYAHVINAYYRLFLDHGGVVAATAVDICRHGPYYPDFDDLDLLRLVPEGYLLRKPAGLRKHDDHYHPVEGTLGNLLMNAAYIGHWVVNNRVVKWNNHPAIVPEDVFMQAFNYLSERTLEGQPNPRFLPTDRRRLFLAVRRRDLPRPLCAGLLESDDGGKRRTVSVHWCSESQDYDYALVHPGPQKRVVWHRKATYMDRAISELLRAKLQRTFATPGWSAVAAALADDLERMYSQAVRQLGDIEDRISCIRMDSGPIAKGQLGERTQRASEAYLMERSRLEAMIARVESCARRRTLNGLQGRYVEVLRNWACLDAEQLRAIFQAFIRRVIASRVDDKCALELVVCWNDDSTDEICLPLQTSRSIYWLDSEVELLTLLINTKASQVEIASSFPDRKWHTIWEKARDLPGGIVPCVFPKPIRGAETYTEYLERASGEGMSHKAIRGERWHPQEIEWLERIVAEGKTQVEIAAAFPHRTWRAIQRRITLSGHRIKQVPGTGQIQRVETYAMYGARMAAESGDEETTPTDECFQQRSFEEALELARPGVNPLNLAVLLLNESLALGE